MQRTLTLLLTTFAFVASLFVAPLPPAHAKRGDAAIGAARLATVDFAKPASPKPERAQGPATTARVFAVEPAAPALASASPPATEYLPSPPDRSELMVFLN